MKVVRKIILILALLLVVNSGHAIEFIVDNSDVSQCIANSSSTTSWINSTYGKNYGTDKLYAVKGDGSKTVTWWTKLPTGRYNIHAWINTAPYAGDAHYQIVHSRGTTAITRSQDSVPAEWGLDLGTYDFTSIGTVILSDYWTGPQLYVVADAIRFVSVSTSEVTWSAFSPKDALALATTDEKPVLIYFSTSKSIDCQKMDSETFLDPTLARWAEKFVTCRVVGEENPEPLRTFKVYRVPTILLLNSKGQEKARYEGFINANNLVKQLNTFLGNIGE